MDYMELERQRGITIQVCCVFTLDCQLLMFTCSQQQHIQLGMILISILLIRLVCST